MTRNGKIARLPVAIREKLNRRLRDNVPGTKICAWVNRLPACRKVCAEFARRGGNTKSPVTVNQLSEWRRGGYQDWLREQQVLEETRELRQWCGKLGRDGGDITEGVATLLSGQLLKLVQGFGKFQVPMESNIKLQAPTNGEERKLNYAPEEYCSGNIEHRTSNAEHRMSDPPESCAPDPSDSDRREACATTEQMEWSVGLLGQLVKCLGGIRRGDHNRVRLAQSEKKLALRSELVAMELEEYEKEKAAAEELERQERAEERSRKRCQLSDGGKIDLLRGRLFGPDRVIAERERELEEREKETKQLQKELEILKEKMPPSTRADEGEMDAESNVHPPSSDCGATSSPKSEVASVPGTPAPNGAEHDSSPVKPGQHAGSPSSPGGSDAPRETGAPKECESIRVNTSASDRLQGKNVGGQAPRRRDAAATKELEAMTRKLEEIKKDQAAFIAELQANGRIKPRVLPINSGRQGASEAGAQGIECLEPDELERELERLEQELVIVNAELQGAGAGERANADCGLRIAEHANAESKHPNAE